MNSRTSSRIKRMSRGQEKRAAADLGGRTQAASGGTRLGGGGDVRVPGNLRLECKLTEKSYYTVRKLELEKIRTEAMRHLERPALQFAFMRTTGRMERYVVVKPISVRVKDEPLYQFETFGKSIRIEGYDLIEILHGRQARLFLAFHDGNRTREWEVLTWEKFLEFEKPELK